MECTLAMLGGYMLHHPLHFLGYKLSLILVDQHFFGPPAASFGKPYISSSSIGPIVQIPTAKTMKPFDCTFLSFSLSLYIYVMSIGDIPKTSLTNFFTLGNIPPYSSTLL